MLTPEAIDKLAASQAIEATAETVRNALNNTGAIALRNDFKVEDLERFMPFRRRLRGNMETTVLSDFDAYVRANMETGAAVFVTPQHMMATAVLNMGTPGQPGHADNRATLTYLRSAAYTALLAIATGKLAGQREAAEFIEDWHGEIECYNQDGSPVENKHAVSALRKVTIESLRQQTTSDEKLSGSRSTFEQVKATQADNLPTTIVFQCVPYIGLSLRAFSVRLGISTGSDKPGFVLRITKAEEHMEQMASEVADLVRESLQGSNVPVMLGDYSAK